MKDFRKGNWIQDLETDGKYYQLEEQVVHDYLNGWLYREGSCWDIDPQPVKLDKDIFIALGFKHYKGELHDKFMLSNTPITIWCGLLNGVQLFTKNNAPKRVTYLHQLQNILEDEGIKYKFNSLTNGSN